jgi:hypothetical protein
VDSKILSQVRQETFGEVCGLYFDSPSILEHAASSMGSMAKSDPETNKFFWGIGIQIYDCYGEQHRGKKFQKWTNEEDEHYFGQQQKPLKNE